MESIDLGQALNALASHRVMVIGWDSATWRLLKPWMDNGELPTLRSLMQNGSSGTLLSTVPPLSPTAWTTFATGQNPAKHGVFDHRFRSDTSYEPVPINSTYRRSIPIWSLVTQQNKNVGLVNVPVTFPPEPVQGYIISGMYTPSEKANYTYPLTLKAELEQAVGGYSVFRRRTGDLDLDLDGLFEIMEIRFRAADYLLSTKPWDLFVLVFQATDVVQHWFWKYMDPSHPDYVASAPARYRSAILDVYRHADAILSRLLRHVDANTFLILLSDHGAGPLYKSFHLDTWLLREGLLRLRRNVATWMKWLVFRSGAHPQRMMSFVLQISPALHGKIAERIMKDRHHRDGKSLVERPFLSSADIDWSRTQAYSPAGGFPGVYLNVQGREPNGCISPGEEYETIRDAIRQGLLELRDPEYDHPIVREVYFREKVFEGPYTERAPDIVFDLDEKYHVFGAHDFSSSAIFDQTPWFSGEHRSDGILVMSGPNIRCDAHLPTAHLADLMPTILYMLGCPVPYGLDGQILKSAFDPGYIRDNPPSFSDAGVEADSKTEVDFSPEDVKVIEDRLRDLGYLG